MANIAKRKLRSETISQESGEWRYATLTDRQKELGQRICSHCNTHCTQAELRSHMKDHWDFKRKEWTHRGVAPDSMLPVKPPYHMRPDVLLSMSLAMTLFSITHGIWV